MAYVLVPPLPPGARKSDYVPLEQLHRKPERSDAAKGKVRAGDNSGSAALAAALQDAFKSNASGSGRTDSPTARGKRKGRGKQKAVEPSVETIEVVDDEDEDEGAEARNQGSATLAHALDAAFAHNSANPNVAAAGQSGSTRHLRRSTRAADFGTVSVEIDVLPPAKRPRGRPRVTTNPDNDHNDRTASAPVSHRRSEKRQPQSPSGPQKKRRRVTQRGDDADLHSSEDDGEIEILDDASTELRRSPRRKPRSKAADPPRPKPRRISQHRRTSMPSRVPTPIPTAEPAPSSPPPTPPPQSPPATPPPPLDSNMHSGHPLTILPVPSPTGIVIAPRALSHLPASPGPPDPQSGAQQQPGQNRSLQGFHGEEAATGAHGLLESPATAATPMDSSLCAIPTTTATTTTTNADLHHHHPLDIGLDMVVPMDIGDVEQQQEERQDPVRAAGVPSHALRISSSTHPDGPMLGFALSEHDDGPGPASLSADADTEASSDGFGLGLGLGANTGPPDMDFMPVSSNSYFNDGIAWGAAGPSTAGVATGDEYVGDGTIDPSVLGGCPGAGSPCKLFRSDTAESSLRGFAFSRPIDDVTDSDFVPSAAASKGKVTVAGAARTRTVVGGGRIGAGNVRIRTKTWRKALADENEDSEDTDTDDAADDDDVEQCLDDVDVAARRQRSTSSNLSPSEASASSLRLQVLRGEEKTFCHHCRCKTRRPKMRCTFIRESTGVQCRKLYCKGCIEKRYVLRFFHLPALTCGLTWGGVVRYPDLTFDEFATSFSCPYCRDFCNCTACSRARGEAYIPERNGGWRRWGKWPVSASAPAAPTTADNASPSSPQSRYQRRKPPRDAVDGAASAALEVTSTPASGTQNTLTDEQLRDKTTARTAPSTPSLPAPQHKRRRRHVYIGKLLKSWGRLVSILDPEDQQQQQSPRRKGQQPPQRKRKRAAGRVRMFAGSEEPLLLLARKKRQRATKTKTTNGRRHLDVSSPATAPVAPLPPPPPPLPPSSSLVRGGETDADCDADEGVWPGEYACAAVPPAGVVVSPRTMRKHKAMFGERAVLRMTPEEVERAIGAAFAVGEQFS